jgi:PAS domain S-box-containing protein
LAELQEDLRRDKSIGIGITQLWVVLRRMGLRLKKSHSTPPSRTVIESKHNASLRESEERYRMLLDGVRDYAIFMMDPQGQILSWNAGAERIKGYTADQIIGQNFSCFFPPADIGRGRPQEVLRTTAAIGRHEEQGMRTRRDGSRFLANVTITALRDPSGNLRGFSEFSHDLSESEESGAKYRPNGIKRKAGRSGSTVRIQVEFSLSPARRALVVNSAPQRADY